MRLELVQVGVIGQIALEMLVAAEGRQVDEHRVVLRVAGVGNAQVVGVGVHVHDLGADLVGFVGKIDAIAQGFAHLRAAVGAGQAQTGGIIGQYGGRLHQCRAIEIVEAAHNLAGLFQHGELIFTHGHGVRHEGGDVRCLAHGVAQEARRNACAEVPHLDLVLYGGVAFQTRQRHEVQIVEGQFAQLRDCMKMVDFAGSMPQAM